ncbi:MAG: double-strand break repair protein AddB [Stappiaceae bacterium]
MEPRAANEGKDRTADGGETHARIYSIPSSASFLGTLADALLDGRLIPGFTIRDDWSLLSDVTIFLPTRRAARTFADILRRRASGAAVILPTIRPLGDVDEAHYLLHSDPLLPDLPPPISPLERRLAMTRLILGWSEVSKRQVQRLEESSVKPSFPASPADAAWLAQDLLALMDQVESEEIEWSALTKVVPEEHAHYWQMTLEFLQIAVNAWPAYLEERGAMDPSAHRSAMIRRETARLNLHPPSGPVIAAGSTGTIPATAALLKTIAGLKNGAVVLPGVDMTLDERSWESLDRSAETQASHSICGMTSPGHPQYGLKRLLTLLGVNRSDVCSLDEAPTAGAALRDRIVSEAMRPVETTDAWIELDQSMGAQQRLVAFEGCALVEADGDIQEAQCVALALREAVENGETAALISPSRTLARRVAVELQRWGMDVDDSAGRPLDQTPPAVLGRLITRVALQGARPVQLLALLKHPLARFGLPVFDVRRAARALERAVLRGPRPEAGISGLIAAIATAKNDQQTDRYLPGWRKLSDEDWQRIDTLVERFGAALKPLTELASERSALTVDDLSFRTLQVLRSVGADEEGVDSNLFDGEAGEALVRLMKALVEEGNGGLAVRPPEWPALLDALLVGVPVRSQRPADPRIHIWGPLEARLHWPDMVVLAGLNEGSWPGATRNDPWLNRPMRGEIGLEPPERRIGLAAHDFTQSLGVKRVVLSRSKRSGGAPTVTSRWVQRLLTVAGDTVGESLRHQGLKYTHWARLMDQPAGPPKTAQRPRPKPPVSSRPSRLSVTEIETWIRDPYAIYARRILGLEPLDPIGASPGAAEKGSIIHDCLAEFLKRWTGPFDEAALADLVSLGWERFLPLQAFPEVHALWWPRFLRVADWFVHSFEQYRSHSIDRRFLECRGVMTIRIAGRSFELVGRADRIDLKLDGTLGLIDYKTGQAPSIKQVEALLSPQLPLEAAIVKNSGFSGIDKGRPISELAYVVLSGGREAGSYKNRSPKDQTIDELASDALHRLTRLIGTYQNPEMGYLSRARVFKELSFAAPYDHLARVQEWSVGADSEAEP